MARWKHSLNPTIPRLLKQAWQAIEIKVKNTSFYRFIQVSCIIMFFMNSAWLMARENRVSSLRVNFSSTIEQPYWYHWSESQWRSKAARRFPNVFDENSIVVTLSANCLKTKEGSEVSNVDSSEMLSEYLLIRGKKLEMSLFGLPDGIYDMNLYFHDSTNQKNNGRAKINLLDSLTNNETLSDRIRFSVSGNPQAVSSFRFPIRVAGTELVTINISYSGNQSFLINGFELTQYAYLEKLKNGVEIIDKSRADEALVAGQKNGEDFLSCMANIDGHRYVGHYRHSRKFCEVNFDGEQMKSSDFVFIKSDPLFKWKFPGNNQLPLYAVKFSSADWGDYYACIGTLNGSPRMPGIYQESNGECIAIIDGDKYFLDKYFVYSQKPIGNKL